MKIHSAWLYLLAIAALTGCGGGDAQKAASPPAAPGTPEIYVATDAKGIQTIARFSRGRFRTILIFPAA